MGKIIEMIDNNFDEVIAKNELVLVDFYASWCHPCKMIAPVLDEIANENEQITIGKMDVDMNSVKPAEFSIRSIPTMLIFKDGEHVDTIIGGQSKKAILAKLTPHLNEEEMNYFKAYHDTRSEMIRVELENGKLKESIDGMETDIRMLRLEVQEKVHEIMELSLSNEDDCQCKEDCSCKGDDEYEELLP